MAQAKKPNLDELQLDEAGISTANAIDYLALKKLEDERESLRSRVNTLEAAVEQRDSVLSRLLPKGMAVRCGRCKNKFYTHNMFGLARDELHCPHCQVFVNTEAFELLPREVDSTRETLIGLLLPFMRYHSAWYAEWSQAGGRNLNLERHYDDVARYLSDMGVSL